MLHRSTYDLHDSTQLLNLDADVLLHTLDSIKLMMLIIPLHEMLTFRNHVLCSLFHHAAVLQMY